MPSAPSRMAFSKLARVFSGNVADAWRVDVSVAARHAKGVGN